MKLNTRKISQSDLELIRYWRNKNFVRNQMLSNDLISSRDQKKWFENLNQKLNHTFIYSHNDIDVGCVSCKITDSNQGTFDVGVYCGNSLYVGHPINFLSMIYIHDYSFFTLKLKKSITIIKNDNESSITINKKIGYTFIRNFNTKFDEYILESSKYEESKKKLSKIVRQIS